MKILALSPFPPNTVSGNVATLKRLQEGLRDRGHDMEILDVSGPAAAERVSAALGSVRPDVVHLYHAYKAGRFAALLERRPTVLTVSGTDLNDYVADPERARVIGEALRRVPVLLTYNSSLAERVTRFFPDAAGRLRVIPKGVRLGNDPFDLRGAAEIPQGSFLFVQAGGIRPVKDNLAALDGLAPLKSHAALVFAGPILDADYGRTFAARLAAEPWARHVPFVPPSAMAAVYRQADAVLNTSRSEGLSNALIEAMACGRPVLAADIPGNRDLIRPEVTGLLYSGPEDLRRQARRLVEDADLRRRLGAAAQEFARREFSTEREVGALLSAYEAARSLNSEAEGP
ncbi:MAG TPA: glycosyltransferase [Planctomycetota bacterium]|nr:glycosyltransferase [Planctomycetota bacterium]